MRQSGRENRPALPVLLDWGHCTFHPLDVKKRPISKLEVDAPGSTPASIAGPRSLSLARPVRGPVIFLLVLLIVLPVSLTTTIEIGGNTIPLYSGRPVDCSTYDPLRYDLVSRSWLFLGSGRLARRLLVAPCRRLREGWSALPEIGIPWKWISGSETWPDVVGRDRRTSL